MGFRINNRKEDRSHSSRVSRSAKIVKYMWLGFIGLGLVMALFLLLIYHGVIGYMPSIEELEDPHDKLASQLFAKEGNTEKEIGRFFEGAGNRVNYAYDSVSPAVIDALIATEDVRFYEHSGIDFRALGRTIVKTLMMGDKSQGGASTITQQLAKQLYSTPSPSLMKRALQKPIEWMIAIKLERFYTKEEILSMYLNRFDFLNNAVGIKTASNVYFGKDPDKLQVQEAAMLVGMLKNPSYYNPLRNPERTRQRRNVVLDQMVKAGKLTAGEAAAYKSMALGIDYHRVDHKEGVAPYFREEIRRMMTAKKPKRPSPGDYKSKMAFIIALSNYNTDSTSWANDPLYGWIEKNPKPDGSTYDLYKDGLNIYTTLDLKMQAYAEQTVVDYVGGVLQPAFTAEKRGNKYGPYTTVADELPSGGAAQLVKNAIRQTERYKTMKQAGHSEAEIEKAFNTPLEMDVFTYTTVTKNGRRQLGTGTKHVRMTPRDSMLYMKSILRCGMVAMDPQTGYVKAYVGGVDFQNFQYDMAGRGRRQIGSTAKPFLYSLAMEQPGEEFTPSTMMPNTQPVYNGWAPRNGRGGGGSISLLQALTTSNNWISARLIHRLGPQQLISKERMFGITGYLEPNLTLCLGTNEVSVKEMVAAYGVFANKGMRTVPVMVTRITDSSGQTIWTNSAKRQEVITEDAYCKMVTMLMNVVREGTGRGLASYGISAETGGKTGTTNSNSDTWFMGFTPQLVVGVWVGGEERTIHFNTMAFGQGAKSALPIYGKFMQALYSTPSLGYSQDAKFEFPEGYRPSYRGRGGHRSGNTEGGGGGETVQGIFD